MSGWLISSTNNPRLALKWFFVWKPKRRRAEWKKMFCIFDTKIQNNIGGGIILAGH